MSSGAARITHEQWGGWQEPIALDQKYFEDTEDETKNRAATPAACGFSAVLSHIEDERPKH